MPKRKLPQGFKNWIEFYSYLKSNRPELLRERTIRFMTYQPNGGVSEAYSVSIACVERQAWRELQASLAGIDTDVIKHSVLQSSLDINDKEKLWKICNILK